MQPLEALTQRETTILRLVFGGSTSREAGIILGISPRTIEFHRGNIMGKFGARNVADLMRIMHATEPLMETEAVI